MCSAEKIKAFSTSVICIYWGQEAAEIILNLNGLYNEDSMAESVNKKSSASFKLGLFEVYEE